MQAQQSKTYKDPVPAEIRERVAALPIDEMNALRVAADPKGPLFSLLKTALDVFIHEAIFRVPTSQDNGLGLPPELVGIMAAQKKGEVLGMNRTVGFVELLYRATLPEEVAAQDSIPATYGVKGDK